MKKLPSLTTIIIAAVALVVGFVIGYSLRNVPPSGDKLAGTIGKADRYRNVKVSENDILLRNELADDTVKRNQYEKYLMYYYYTSLKTSSDLEQVLAKVKSVDDFQKVSAMQDKRLSSLREYHNNSRPEILNALNLLVEMDKGKEEPIIDQLNLAQNVISRIKNQKEILMDYMNFVSNFIHENQEGRYPDLADAYDILNLNVLQQALVTHDKPVLKYFQDKQLMNNKEGAKELRNLENFKEFVKDQVTQDAANEGIGDVVYTDQVTQDAITCDQVFSDAIDISLDQFTSDAITCDQVFQDISADQAFQDVVTYDQAVSDAISDQVVGSAQVPK